jgi:transposase
MDRITYMGIDLHKKNSYVTIVDEKGRVIKSGKIITSPENFREFMQNISKPVKVASEATIGWYWLYDMLEQMEGVSISVAHPTKIKAITSSKKKNDRGDSEILAQLLRLNYLPTSYVPPKNIRFGRERIRFRRFEVQTRTKLKNKVHSILFKLGQNHDYSDIFGKSGREFIEDLDIEGVFKEQMYLCLETIDTLSEHINSYDASFLQEARSNPNACILMTIPGIGPFLSYSL